MDRKCPKCKKGVGSVCYRIYDGKGKSGSPIRIPELLYCPNCKIFLTIKVEEVEVIKEL
jgi:hypothetical protein